MCVCVCVCVCVAKIKSYLRKIRLARDLPDGNWRLSGAVSVVENNQKPMWLKLHYVNSL